MGLTKPPRPWERNSPKMKRRGFLSRLLGTAVVTALDPNILHTIEQYEYEVEGKPRPKKKTPSDHPFIQGRGFWAIYEGEIVGWSTAENTVLSMDTPRIDVTSMDDGGVPTFIPGPMSARFEVEGIRSSNMVKLQELMMEGLVMDIVATVGRPEEWPRTFTGQGIITELGIGAALGEDMLANASFQISGELIMTEPEHD